MDLRYLWSSASIQPAVILAQATHRKWVVFTSMTRSMVNQMFPKPSMSVYRQALFATMYR